MVPNPETYIRWWWIHALIKEKKIEAEFCNHVIDKGVNKEHNKSISLHRQNKKRKKKKVQKIINNNYKDDFFFKIIIE